MKTTGAVLALTATWGFPLAAQSETAKGSFKSGPITMEVKSAVAFRGAGLLDKDVKDALIVVISNAKMTAPVLADYYDRRRAIDKRLKDDGTGVVYLEFGADGKYRGLSFYFASGNGCGYCGGGVASTVKLSGGKLSGTIKAAEENRSFDVTLDVPVMSDDHGSALPEGGGDPGKAYMAYHAALAKGDDAALKPLLSQERQETWARFEKKGNGAGFVRFLSSEHPTKSMKITKGWSKGDKAVLLVRGESPVMKLAGEVNLVKEKGGWRVDDELMDVVLE